MHRFVQITLLMLLASHAFGGLADIRLPDGFEIEVYADVPKARSLALGDKGTVFVSNRRADSIYAIIADNQNRRRVIELRDDLSSPNGIAYHNGDLYVAEPKRVLRFRNIENRLQNVPEPDDLDIKLQSGRIHYSRFIGFGPDNKLYVNIGAPCNICDRDGFGRIIRMNADGSEREVFASGIRNSVGFTWHPDTGEMWFTDNGRDWLGDDSPPGELNRAPRPGMHFGYPYCHGGDISDPEFGGARICDEFTPPVQKLGPHVAPLGLRFYTGEMFPKEYHGQVFIAEHGSWNRSEKIGYRVSMVRLNDGRAVSYEVFADGWLDGQSVSGRPVDLLVLEDGSMLVSDDHAGKVYRISYREPRD